MRVCARARAEPRGQGRRASATVNIFHRRAIGNGTRGENAFILLSTFFSSNPIPILLPVSSGKKEKIVGRFKEMHRKLDRWISIRGRRGFR